MVTVLKETLMHWVYGRDRFVYSITVDGSTTYVNEKLSRICH